MEAVPAYLRAPRRATMRTVVIDLSRINRLIDIDEVVACK